ncbi:hypothetical protein NCER_100827 [Vairimorpha ceranae BRL01]|uniref:Uncharacterized protein n=1 Tax=Vairimorpha ceranae (strain BRL01) TaxID=578460 RepID=C4V8J6_VAIC1|nr:hypothetical protein NCER_100827 [Vairimorpha ceranae BRL01]
MLRIQNLSMRIEDEIICFNQHFEVKGVCSVVGRHNKLRECLISIFSNSVSKYIHGLDFDMKVFFKGVNIKKNRFIFLLCPYTLLNAKDNIEDILYFVNKDLAEQVIKDFRLHKFRYLSINELSPSIFNILEIAIGICSCSSVLYFSLNPDPYRNKYFYLKLLQKYAILNEAVIFVEGELLNVDNFDSYLLIKDNSIFSFIIGKDKKINAENYLKLNTFIYKTYISKFNVRGGNKINYDIFTDNNSLSVSDTSSLVNNIQYTDVDNVTKFIIFKHKICKKIIKYYTFLVPDVCKVVILINSKLHRKQNWNKIRFYYANIGNITLLIVIYKHWYSLHMLLLMVIYWIFYYFLTIKGISITAFIFKSRKRFHKICYILDFFIIIMIFKYLIDTGNISVTEIYIKANNEYFVKFNPFLCYATTSIAYTLILYSSVFHINEDYAFVREYLYKSYNSSTYYFYLILISLFSSALPLIIFSFVINLKYICAISLNAIFIIPLFNLFRHTKSKVITMSYIVTRNFFYSLNYKDSVYYKICNFIDPFIIVRSAIFDGFKYEIILRLVCIYICIFLVFCTLL